MSDPGVSLRADEERPVDTYTDRCIKYLLRFGPVPQHVAFIMDGNRRYAAKAEKDKSFGHSQGYGKLESVVEWCSQIGIRAVTTYAFSIENFKRSSDEVNYLMKLAENKADYLFKNQDLLEKYKICIIFSGNLSFLSSSLRNQCNKLMEMTRNNTGFFCNICLAYTSSDELAAVATSLADNMNNGTLTADEVTPELIDRCLSTSAMGTTLPPVDIIVRTSGEVRLSDFLLWQSAFSMFAFVDTLWPDFSLWDFAKVILRYKWHCSTLKYIKHQYFHLQPEYLLNSNQETCVKEFCEKRAMKIE